MDTTDPSSTGAAVAEAPPEPAQRINERFLIGDRIGSGGMGAVFLVRDTLRDGRLLALKQVRGDRADQTTLNLLRTEFLTLTELRHPNLTAVYDFGIDRATKDLFYTSEFVDGVDWLTAMDALDLQQERPFRTFLALVVQALRALEFIHGRGLVHCDIKPENILITGVTEWRTSVPKLKVIDFGLVKRERVRSGKKVLGTPYYVAPETILGSPVDRRGDLYSLGVVLYHLVTGKPPFRGPSNLAILKNHVETAPEPPHKVVPSLSRRLSAIILRLMEKNPSRRFQGALEIIDAINAAFSTTFSLGTDETLRSYLDASWLVGREREIELLEKMFRRCVHPNPIIEGAPGEVDSMDPDLLQDVGGDGELNVPPGRMILLLGEKGLGKQRLVEKLWYQAQTEGASCIEVPCDKYIGPGVQEFRQLLDSLRTLGSGANAPQNSYLQRADAFLKAVSTSEHQLRGRGAQNELQSLVRGFLKVTRDCPTLLCLHDLHRASRLMTRVVELLAQAQAEEWVADSRLLVVGTLLEQAEVERWEFHRIRSKPAFRGQILELALARLERADVNRLIRSAFVGSRFPSAFVQRVHEESDGNTGVALEILEFLLAGDHVQRQASSWSLDKDYQTLELPGKVRRALRESLAKLPQPALHLGIALACMEHHSVVEVAVAVAGVAPRNVPRYLVQLKQDNIIQERMDGSARVEYSFVHQSAKTLLYTRIAAKNRPAIHNRIGALLEDYYLREGGGSNKELAHHYLQARNGEKGVQYGLEAAREYAREAFPLQAIATYKSVLSLADEEDLELQNRVRWEIAALRLKVGDYKGVLDLLEPLCASEARAEGIREETALYLQVARAQICLGSFDEAGALLERRLEIEESTGDRDLLARVLLECAFLAHVRGKTVESLRYCHRVESLTEHATDHSFQVQLYMLMAENHARLHDEESAAGYCQRALRLIDAQHDADLLDLSFFCRGRFYKYRHKYRSSLKQFHLCVMLRAKKRVFDGQADCLLEIGTLHVRLGLPHKARPHLAKARAIYKRTGNLRGSTTALAILAEADRLTGQYEKVSKNLSDALERAGSFSDEEIARGVFASFAGIYADRGELRRSETFLDRVRTRGTRGTSSSPVEMNALALRSEVMLWRGNFAAAMTYCDSGLQIARELRDPGGTANYLVQRCLLSSRLGRSGEARRSIASLMELAQRHELHRQEGWGRLIEGVVLAQERRIEPAEKAFALATDLFMSHGSERDMIALYLEYGLFCLERQDHEQSYLNLEEGFYLARKLDLSYLKCRFFFARGLLEASLSGEETSRAAQSLRFAANLSARAPFQDLRWQVHYQFGKLLAGTDRDAEARKHFEVAHNSFQDVIVNIPMEYRDSYTALHPVDDLARCVVGPPR